jgi:hypothetical protein
VSTEAGRYLGIGGLQKVHGREVVAVTECRADAGGRLLGPHGCTLGRRRCVARCAGDRHALGNDGHDLALCVGLKVHDLSGCEIELPTKPNKLPSSFALHGGNKEKTQELE